MMFVGLDFVVGNSADDVATENEDLQQDGDLIGFGVWLHRFRDVACKPIVGRLIDLRPRRSISARWRSGLIYNLFDTGIFTCNCHAASPFMMMSLKSVPTFGGFKRVTSRPAAHHRC